MRYSKFIFATLIYCVILVGNVSFAVETKSIKLTNERLNELASWDLGNDGIFEIFTTSISGNAACYRSDNLDRLWSKKIGRSALTAPVIGDFLGTGAAIMAMGSSDGNIYFLWPGTGETIAAVKVDSTFTIAPSLVRLPSSDSDCLILPDDTGQIFIYGLTVEGTPRELWKIPNTISGSGAFSVVGRTIQPVSCADINKDSIPEVLASSNEGVLQIVSLSNPHQRYFIRLAQKSEATTLAGIGSYISPAQNSIILGVNASLFAFEFRPESDNSIKQLFETPVYGKSQGHILIGQINDDAIPDVVTSADNVISARYSGNDFNGKQTLIDIASQQLTTINPPFSPALPITKSDNKRSIVAFDNKGTAICWNVDSPTNNSDDIAHLLSPTGFTPAGNLTGSGKLSLIVWSEAESTLNAVHTDIELSRQSPPLLTLGINYSRNGQFGTEWGAQWASYMTRLQSVVESARDQLSRNPDNTESALDPASILTGSAPMDPAGDAYRNPTGTVKVIAWIVGLLVMAIVTTSAVIYLFKMRNKTKQL